MRCINHDNFQSTVSIRIYFTLMVWLFVCVFGLSCIWSGLESLLARGRGFLFMVFFQSSSGGIFSGCKWKLETICFLFKLNLWMID